MTFTQTHYQALADLMSLDNGILSEDLLLLKDQANNCRRQFRSQIHQQMSSQQMDSATLSTLLNVNKEVYNSKSALVKALNEICE